MEPGWHVYALDQEPGGPVPMRITLPQQAFVMDSDIDSPVPKSAFDPNFGIEVRFYEDEATFAFHLKVGSQTPCDPLKILVDVLYQTCTQQICMPPRVAHLRLALRRQAQPQETKCVRGTSGL
jgi:DsbC/DsbD-like thiol-disulfide interchange protein